MFISIGNSLQQGERPFAYLPVLTIGSFFGVRGIVMYVKRHDIIRFLNVLDREFPHDLPTQRVLQVRQVYEGALRRHKYVEILIHISIYGFCLMPLTVYMFTRDTNGPITVEQQLLGGWLPFGLSESHKAYPLAWLYDVVVSISGVAFFSTFDTLFYTMHGQIIMHLDSLSMQLKSLNWTSEDNTQLFEQLCPLIRRHQYLNLLCDQFNDIFNAGIMITDLMAATTICFHLYLLTETDDQFLMIRYLIPIVSLILFTFEICHRGAQLEEAYLQLNATLYNQDWYKCDQKIRKLILIWLKYTQCIKKLNAYGLMELNMVHFTDVMKLTYRLFTFLKTT
ncbi:odorant receptor 88a [Drosophila innubila]|uniref:odorant receptor 88a n=1 Tax=Drosophila innubila TaxID=198719 RepID=UPI00148DDD36|nr:odorant receptor 88a [Drosophila innubila]